MKREIILTVLFNLVLSTMLFAQSTGTIEGTVNDQKTGMPVANVNVYINGSTVGASTNKDGNFKLEHIPSGVYEVVFLSLGYDAVFRKIVLSRNQTVRVDVDMKPLTYNMGDVNVTSKVPKVWRRRLKEFKTEFLGTSSFSNECTIENPEVLNFNRDKKTGALVARADSILIIINRALGYRLYIRLNLFQWGHINGIYDIYPYFKEMKPTTPEELTEWEANRKEAFDRSFRYFLYALVNHEALDDGFRYNGGIVELSPKENMDLLNKQGLYNVGLKGFRISKSVDVHYKQLKSKIIMKKAYFFVDSNGNILNPLSVTIAGYWGRNRVGSLLPFNYRPKD